MTLFTDKHIQVLQVLTVSVYYVILVKLTIILQCTREKSIIKRSDRKDRK